MWKAYGEWLATSDMTATRVYQKATPSVNMELTGCRTQIIIYNNPSFTSLNMKIYSNRSGAPAGLISTSTNAQLKAEIHTLSHALKEIYFDFSDVVFKADETYHFVLNATGYTGTTSSHIAWKHSYPNPAYQTNVDMSVEGAYVSPFDLTLFGRIL